MKKLYVVLFILICFSIPLTAQNRGSDEGGGAREVVDARGVVKIGKQWAVFIAIDKYKEWDPLGTPVSDAKEIRDTLWKQYYIDEVRELYDDNATYNKIYDFLVDLRSQVGIDDSVFIFYAGHGYTDPNTSTGYWIPLDGQWREAGQANWMANRIIRELLTKLPAKHVLLISDSCFSGDILDLSRGDPPQASPQIDTNYYRRVYDIASRQVMTSGASETVPEPSEFILKLKNALLYAKGVCFDPDYLFTAAEVRDVKSTRPILAPIRNTGLQEGGSFLFFRRQTPNPEPLPKNTTPITTTKLGSSVRKEIAPGEPGYFIGSWVADVVYNGSYDTYYINLSANNPSANSGSCKVKIINDTAQQETTGRWSFDGKYFKLNATFRNPAIAYVKNIDWLFEAQFVGNYSFKIIGKAATDAKYGTLFTFDRE